MASTSVSRIVPATPERVWELIGGFDSLPDWMPFIRASTLQERGRTRRLATADGGEMVERLMAFSEAERSYSYAIVQGPFPVAGYIGTLRVYPVAGQADAAEVVWSARFTSAGGATDQEVVELFARAFRDGLEALGRAVA